jgi:hypothetical protein
MTSRLILARAKMSSSGMSVTRTLAFVSSFGFVHCHAGCPSSLQFQQLSHELNLVQGPSTFAGLGFEAGFVVVGGVPEGGAEVV